MGTNPKSDVSELSEEEPVESEEPVEDLGLEDSEFLEEPDEFDSEVSEEPTEDSYEEFDDDGISDEPTDDSDDDVFSEEPTEDLASSEEADNQEQPEHSAVTGEEAKELDAHEKPTEEVKLAPEAT